MLPMQPVVSLFLLAQEFDLVIPSALKASTYLRGCVAMKCIARQPLKPGVTCSIKCCDPLARLPLPLARLFNCLILPF